ncbi:hypothetical protein NVP2117O_29 [Vibrio phage 2.117.O._10N.261.45.E9]|nr:hypothetical protein NVP1117O_29 [Vibrio phage 1.117.O._10N.261.45.E9]AUR95430.1 hypothetical protein NVP1207B_23 [Vibrio phage 1.207.B._10N.222.51.C2]AUS02321.1 hypothetical protein NVP2117O_29 [Vibrio phage 2.117.O._10N.261.45.E9]
MATSNEQLLDAYIRNQTYILRFASWLRNQAGDTLVKHDQKTADLIMALAGRMEGVEPSSQKGKRLLAQFQKDLIEMRRPVWKEVSALYNEELVKLAAGEVAWSAKMVAETAPVVLNLKTTVPASQLSKVVKSNPYQGKVLGEWLRSAAGSESAEIMRRVKIGVADGLTARQTATAVLGAASEGGAGGTTIKSIRDAETIAITMTNGVTTASRQEFYNENSDVIKTEIFVATLDGSTTYECAGHDQTVHKVGEGPMPPLHPRCRSIRIAYIDPSILAQRPAKPVVEKAELKRYAKAAGLPAPSSYTSRNKLPRGHKTAYDRHLRKAVTERGGSIPERKSYEAWFKTQPKSFQLDYLGPARYKLYKDGDVDIRGLTGGALNRTLTVDQISARA